MNKKELILITGMPSAGKSVIANSLGLFPDQCNVVDMDSHGGWKYENGVPKWYVKVFELGELLNDLRDKPTFVIGMCDNLANIIKMIGFTWIYWVDTPYDIIAKRLNERYEKSGGKHKMFWTHKYGANYLNEEAIEDVFSDLLSQIGTDGVVYLPQLKILSECFDTIYCNQDAEEL